MLSTLLIQGFRDLTLPVILKYMHVAVPAFYN